MRIASTAFKLQLRSPFAIAHGTSAVRWTVLVRVTEGGYAGLGEIPVVPYYGINEDFARQQLGSLWNSLSYRLSGLHETPDCREFSRMAEQDTEHHPFVRSGLSSALLDLYTKRENGSRTSKKSSLENKKVRSSFTIAERNPKTAVEIAAALPGVILKIKTGFDGDMDLVGEIASEVPGRTMWIDCNGGWNQENAQAKAKQMENLGVTLIEEPISGDFKLLGKIAGSVGIPVLADESLRTPDDCRELLSKTPSNTGAVVKVAKHGGPWASREIMSSLRKGGRRFMVGQMIESSIGTSGALSLAPDADWVDLDSPILIANDPGIGLEAEAGSLRFRDGFKQMELSGVVQFGADSGM